MKNLVKKLGFKYLNAKYEAKRFLTEQRGDTNFISIAIIMVVVIAVAVIFIAFSDKIKELFNTATQELFGALGA